MKNKNTYQYQHFPSNFDFVSGLENHHVTVEYCTGILSFEKCTIVDLVVYDSSVTLDFFNCTINSIYICNSYCRINGNNIGIPEIKLYNSWVQFSKSYKIKEKFMSFVRIEE